MPTRKNSTIGLRLAAKKEKKEQFESIHQFEREQAAKRNIKLQTFLGNAGQRINLTAEELAFLKQNVPKRKLWPLQLAWRRFEQAFPLPERTEENAKAIDHMSGLRAHAFIEAWNFQCLLQDNELIENRYVKAYIPEQTEQMTEEETARKNARNKLHLPDRLKDV